MSTSSIPLKIQNANGDLQEFTPAQEEYLAYAVSEALAAAAVSDTGNLSLTDGVNIGSFVDTYYNEVAGTHPASNITSTTVTTTLKQVGGTADESGANFVRPVGYYELGSNPGFYEMTDDDLDLLVTRAVSTIETNQWNGIYRLSSVPPSPDYKVAISNVFTDTLGDGTTTAYHIYQKDGSFIAPTEARPVAICYDVQKYYFS